jgi:hypothetical protein
MNLQPLGWLLDRRGPRGGGVDGERIVLPDPAREKPHPDDLFERQMRVSPRQDVRAAWPSTIARWPPALFVISTRRGFAASATGILSVSTPWS